MGSWWQRLLGRLRPRPRMQVDRPITTRRQGAVVHQQTGLALSFTLFGGRPAPAPRPARRAPAPAPRRGNPVMNVLFGPPSRPLTDREVRAVPLVRRAPTPEECRARCAVVTAAAPDYLAGLRHQLGLAEGVILTREGVQTARAQLAAMEQIAAKLDKQAKVVPPRPRAKAAAANKPIVVRRHTRNGKLVQRHTRARPGQGVG